MRFRNQLFWTFAIQGGGAGAFFLAVIALGSIAGPEVQGTFNRLKSEIEFVASLALFGMPPAVLYFSSGRKLGVRRALWISFGSAMLAAAVAALYVLVSRPASISYLALFVVACSAYVAHSILRVVVLSTKNSVLFNIITALPQCLILLLIVGILTGSFITIDAIIAVYIVSFLTAGIVAYAIIVSSKHPSSKKEAKLSEMFVYGAATAVGTTLNAAANLLWIRYIEGGLGLAAVGIFTMGLTFVQAAVAPINYAAPLLLKRWVETPYTPKIMPAILTGLATFLMFAVAIQFESILPAEAAHSSYGELLALQWCFVLAAVAEVTLRVPMSAVYAAGRPWFFPMAEAVRLTILTAGLVVGVGSLWQASWVWAISAAVATGILIASVRLLVREPTKAVQ